MVVCVPSGKFHSNVTAIASGAILAFMLRNGFPMSESLQVSLGCLSGIVFTPDLDVDNGSISHKVVDKYLGIIVGGAWRVVTTPYAKLVTHRSFVSHFPFIGTLVRVLYFGSVIFTLKSLFSLEIEFLNWDILIRAFIGLSISDALHILFDIFWKQKSSTNVMGSIKFSNNKAKRC